MLSKQEMRDLDRDLEDLEAVIHLARRGQRIMLSNSEADRYLRALDQARESTRT